MQIAMDQARFDELTARLKSSQGIALTGPQGTIEKMGVKASYLFDGQMLTVEVLEKPMIVSKEYVEKQFKEWLG
jgi:hypothetical protein